MNQSVKQCIFHDIDADRRDRHIFELVENAFGSNERVVVYVENSERAASIDRILWILKQEAFLPHKVFQKQEVDPGTAIAIVTEEINPVGAQTLIADGHCDLNFAEKFQTIHEFVTRATPEIQEACRERFRTYRARKLQVDHKKS